MLFCILFDAKRMLDENMKPKKVLEYLDKKIDFLKHPPPGNKIDWQ
jgi:hypothetical protein